MKYREITVGTNHEGADLVSLIMIEEGSEGVSVKDPSDAESLKSFGLWDYADPELFNSDGCVYVTGGFPEDYVSSGLKQKLAALSEKPEFGKLTVTEEIKDTADYENEWKKFYRPLTFERVTIVPKWLKCGDADTIPVYLDPGMAFGTGKHETTSMCVRLLQCVHLDGARIADVGCGSGILGITAVKLGGARAFMSDLDSQATAAAGNNARLNGVEDKVEIKLAGLLSGFSESFDVIIANITADVLLRFLPDAEQKLKKGGNLILSGVINGRESEIERAYGKRFTLVNKLSEGEWNAYLFEKK